MKSAILSPSPSSMLVLCTVLFGAALLCSLVPPTRPAVGTPDGCKVSLCLYVSPEAVKSDALSVRYETREGDLALVARLADRARRDPLLFSFHLRCPEGTSLPSAQVWEILRHFAADGQWIEQETGLNAARENYLLWQSLDGAFLAEQTYLNSAEPDVQTCELRVYRLTGQPAAGWPEDPQSPKPIASPTQSNDHP